MIKKFLLVGLGNPEKQYEKNRHNVGYNFISYLAEKWESPHWEKNQKCLAEVSFLNTRNQKIILAKPLVFMNNSGKTVSRLKRFYDLSLKNIFIIHDDTDISFGGFKISYNRGSAGHKGVESIINYLRTKGFYRVRIGICSPCPQRKKAEEVVLKNFTPQENKILKGAFSIIEERLEEILFRKNK